MSLGSHKIIHFDADKLIGYLKSHGVHSYKKTYQSKYCFSVVIDAGNNNVIVINYMRWGKEDNNGKPVYSINNIKHDNMEFIKSYVDAIKETINGDLSEVDYIDGFVINDHNINEIVDIVSFGDKNPWRQQLICL